MVGPGLSDVRIYARGQETSSVGKAGTQGRKPGKAEQPGQELYMNLYVEILNWKLTCSKEGRLSAPTFLGPPVCRLTVLGNFLGLLAIAAASFRVGEKALDTAGVDSASTYAQGPVGPKTVMAQRVTTDPLSPGCGQCGRTEVRQLGGLRARGGWGLA